MMPETREAVETIVRAEVDDTGGRTGLVVGECVVIAAANGWDEDGDDISQVVIIPDGSESRLLGLIEHARLQLRTIIAGDGE